METPEVVVAQPDAEVVTETPAVETAVEVVEQPQTSDDLWASVDLSFETPTPDETDNSGQDDQTPETVVEPPQSEEVEDEPEAETPSADEGSETIAESPYKLNRKDLRKAEAQLITPFRDPETPIEDVLKSMYEFNPIRTRELTEAVAKDLVSAYPDDVLQAVTGIEGITVEQVKQAVSGQPTATVPDIENSDYQAAIDTLTEIYGDNWRDPANDAELIGDDALYVPALRDALKKQDTTEKDAEIQALKTQLEELKPTVESIKTEQQASFERQMNDAYKTAAVEYRGRIEGKVIPQLLQEAGMVVSEADTAEVKGVKELVNGAFQSVNEYASDFDLFASHDFSGKDQLLKVVSRVDKFLNDASKAQAEASRATKDAVRQRYSAEAESLRQQAMMEEDTLAVLTQKAAKEFLASPRLAPVVKLLERNADLERLVNQSAVRPELLGSATSAGGESWADRVKAAAATGVNPFEMDISNVPTGITR